MFYDVSGECYKKILRVDDGVWMISYDEPRSPIFVSNEEEDKLTRIEAPKECFAEPREMTAGEAKRWKIIEPMMDDERCITDRSYRNILCRKISRDNDTTNERVKNLYFLYLAGKPLMKEKKMPPRRNPEKEKNFIWAIETFYFSAKKPSLRDAYDMLLLSRYTDENGRLKEDYPTFCSFKHFYYDKGYQNKSRKYISRNGITDYQRNKKPLYGTSRDWKNRIGTYEMDATICDLYLVSRLDRNEVIGRPYLYLAVDTSTQLIAGINVTMRAGEEAVLSCIANAAMDKVSYCKRYGIQIGENDWPSRGLPKHLVTDKGSEFYSQNILTLLRLYGMELETLPPFRPDQKGSVEKAFDLIQSRYKPILHGNGVIDTEYQERYGTDYRKRARLTLYEFTAVVIHSVLYLNNNRILKGESCPVGVRPTARDLWLWSKEQGESDLIPANEDRIALLGWSRAERNLTRKGICHKGLYYTCKEYGKLLDFYGPKKKMKILYNPDEVGWIYLVDGEDYKRLELAQSCKLYVGIGWEEYDLSKRTQKQMKKELEKEEIEGRIKTAKSIQEILENTKQTTIKNVNMKRIKQNKKRECD